MSLKGGVRHGGLFPAMIEFPEAVVFSWVVSSKKDQEGKGRRGRDEGVGEDGGVGKCKDFWGGEGRLWMGGRGL